MIKEIIIAHLYNPGSAATNRIIAYTKGYHNLGLHVILVLGSMHEFDRPNLPDWVEIICCVATQSGINKKMSRVIKNKYQTGVSVIQIYGSPALCFYLPKTKYNIFYECTEAPYYGKKKSLKTWPKETIKRWLVKRATGMMVISKALKLYFEAEGIKNIVIINMFVDVSRFDTIVPEGEEKYIAYCGTISPFKDGVDCLIKAFHIFHESHNDFKLNIIGCFQNNNSEQEVRTLVKKFALDEAVQFTGLVSPEDMPKLLKGATMLVLARPNNVQAQYGFPTKLGEYLATGKPVVVTRVGEIGDFLIDGVNCRLAEPDNPEDFAEKINWVVENYSEALALGKEGKALTTKAFSSDEQCKKVVEFMNLHLKIK